MASQRRNKRNAAIHSVRFNRKAVIIVAALLVVTGIGGWVLKRYQNARVNRDALHVAEKLRDSGESEMALRHLNQHLRQQPGDLDSLALRAEIMAKAAKAPAQLLPAAQAQSALIRASVDRKDANAPDIQKARRRLASLYIRYSDELSRTSAGSIFESALVTSNSRYGAAEVVANELILNGADDVEAYRLRAQAREGLAVPGDRGSLDRAIADFRTVLAMDPTDLVAAEHLAGLYRDRLKDEARAENVLDDLLAAKPKSVEVRLARHRHFLKLRKDELAARELGAATEIAPDDLDVIMAATEDALRRGNTAEARAHLDKIPESSRGELRVLMARGMIDFGEEHPDEAVAAWRRGLMTSAGNDSMTTWWLAYALIQLGRVTDAKPLVGQYQRLVGKEAPLLHFLEALLAEKDGRPVEAIRLIEQIRERFAPNWEGLIQLARGRCHEALFDEHKAAEAYTRAIQIEPTMTVHRLALAKLRLKRRPTEAVVEIERGLALIPNDPALRVGLAGALLRDEAAKPKGKRAFGDFDRAWDRAQAVAPGVSPLVLMHADRLALAGQEAEAVDYLEKVAHDAPKSAAVAVALAEGLSRLNKPDRALAVIARATEAVGDQASLRITRAKALTALNRGREARAGLVKDADKLPPAERHQVWVALGQLETARGNDAEARRAYLEWAKLLPDDPRPLLVLLELALGQTDETVVRHWVEELGRISEEDVAYRLGRAKELLWLHDAAKAAEGTEDASLREAASLVDRVLAEAPALPAAQMTRGQLFERTNRPDDAAAAYERAWENGVEAALPRLVELYSKRRRFEALAKLRETPGASSGPTATAKLDLLSAQAFVRLGDRTQAGRIAEQLGRAMPNSAQALGWQVRMLEHLGKIDDAEAALSSMAERQPGELGSWLKLLEFQTAHRREASKAATVARIKAGVQTDRPERLDAQIARAAQDYTAADQAYRAAVARDPEDVALLFEAADFYEKAGQTLESESLCRRVLAKDPKNRPAARQLAEILASRRDPVAWEQAWKVLGPETPGDEPEDRRARAVVLAFSTERARQTEAMRVFDDLLADLPASHPTATLSRKPYADLLLQFDRGEKASQVVGVSATEGSDPDAIALYAKALIQSKNPAAAEWALERLSAVNPGDLREAGLRARLIWDRSRPTEAAVALERAYIIRENGPGAEALGREAFILLLGMGPEQSVVAERLGRRLATKNPALSWMPATILAGRGLADEALALLKPALRPGTPAEELREVGRCAMTVAIGSDDAVTLNRAAGVLTAALAIEPNSDELLVMTAMLRHLQRDYKEEVRLYRQILPRRPESYVVLTNLAWALSEGLHTPKEAEDYLETLMRVAGGDPAAIDTHAVIQLRLGKAEDAVKQLEKLVKLKPLPVYQFHLARAYHAVGVGREKEARQSLEEARKAGLNPREIDIAERDEFKALNEALSAPLTVGQAR